MNKRHDPIGSREDRERDASRRETNAGIGMLLGVVIGVTIGLLMDNIAVGIVVGIAIGVGAGPLLGAVRKDSTP